MIQIVPNTNIIGRPLDGNGCVTRTRSSCPSEGVRTGGDPRQAAGWQSLGGENTSHGNSPRYETRENGITAMHVNQARAAQPVRPGMVTP
jgi:hypothetical protein